jgi:hypothetical protein
MPRRIMTTSSDSQSSVLIEVGAHDEAQLQERMKATPDLLPLDDLGMSGTAMVIGRETRLASGAADLLMVSRGGDILVVEFKTGPQNSDFRAALAQVLDYGSDLWGLSYDEFEQTVPLRYFKSRRADALPLKDCTSLIDAAAVVWKDEELTEEEQASFRDRVAASLKRGAFHYIIVAQRFTLPMESTARYLNSSMPDSHFSLVEMVRFQGDDVNAFEARTVLRGTAVEGSTSRDGLTRSAFLDSIKDLSYRAVLEQILGVMDSLGLIIFWGTSGVSFRLRVGSSSVPISLGWLFAPGTIGWMGLRDLTLGYDPASPGVAGAELPLTQYSHRLTEISGHEPTTTKKLNAVLLRPDVVIANAEGIVELITETVHELTKLE